jgi:hypothetical protein
MSLQRDSCDALCGAKIATVKAVRYRIAGVRGELTTLAERERER